MLGPDPLRTASHWREPAVVITQFLAVIKLMHLLGGIYIWEFFSNIGYEYSIITGKRKFTWSFPLYLGCRWCPLFAITTYFVLFNLHNEVDCHALILVSYLFGYLSFAFASALVILRVVAIWNRNKIVIAILAVFWLGTIGSYIYCTATTSATWVDLFETCQVQNIAHTRISIFSTLMSDIVLLLLMLIGLFRWRHCRQRHGTWWLLYTQGLAWVLLVTLAEVPPAVFLTLDLNDPFDLMFQPSALFIMTIGASRLYRGLAEAFYHRSTKAPAGSEGSTELRFLRSLPRVPSHKVGLATETYTGGSVLAPKCWPTTTFDSGVAKV